MSGEPFDLAVIGGGINGCGIARDAAGRGARVLLLEAGDLAQGTSSASTKLIHGGLRYLEHREFALVREALQERERLWAMAPHLIRPQRFVLPQVPGLRPAWLLRLGLFLYDHIGGRKRLPATQTVRLADHPAGAALKPGPRRGFVYSDCTVDDARLVVANARDAADRGAEVRTRTPATGLAREGGLWRIATPHGTFHARAVVNAAGPGVLAVLDLAGQRGGYSLRLVRGSHLVVPKLFDHAFAYFFQLRDGRIFFAIPYETDFTLIGTTDADHAGPLDQVAPSVAEIAYLCEAASRQFARAVKPQDAVWTFAGVRPLVDDGSGRPEAATRGYRLELSPEADGAPLLSVFGGKITTYRHLAQQAVDLLAERLPLGGLPSGWTGEAPLPGGDFPVDGADALIAQAQATHPGGDPATARRLVRAYGTGALELAAGARQGEQFGHGLGEGELRHLMAREWAQTADDVLWRRTKLGLRFTPRQTARLAAWMAENAR